MGKDRDGISHAPPPEHSGSDNGRTARPGMKSIRIILARRSFLNRQPIEIPLHFHLLPPSA
jgi:hypothetical protein